MNLRSVMALFMSAVFAATFLPSLASAQDSPSGATGLTVTSPVLHTDTTFDAEVTHTATPDGWAWTAIFVDGVFATCIDKIPDVPGSIGGVTTATVTVPLNIPGIANLPGTYDIQAVTEPAAGNANCDIAQSYYDGDVFDPCFGAFGFPNFCPSDGLIVLTTGTFSVAKDFSDDNPGNVDVSISCTDAAVSGGGSTTGVANESTPAEFTLEWDASLSPTCTASETPVVGYTDDTGDACTGVSLVSQEDASCTLVNTQNPVNITVNKAYTEAHPIEDSEAEITLTCPSGTVTTSPITTTGGVATFEVSNFPWDGEDCTATESDLPGYVLDDATGCDALTVIPGDTDPADSCTITNRPTEATFTVDKQFSDGNTVATTTAEVTCSGSGNGPGLIFDTHPNAASGTIGENTDYVTTVKWFDTSATCDATEIDLAGYTQDLDQGDCDEGVLIDDETDGTCVIYNDQDPVVIEASKLYEDGGDAAVDFAVVCSNLDEGGSVTPASASASPGTPAEFEVSDFMFDGSTTCSVTEPTPPPGFAESANTCADLSIVPSDDPVTCEITNSPVPARATFRVTKYYADDNDVDEITVTLDCNTGLILDQDKELSDGEWVEFIVTDFTEGNLACTITEDGEAGYSGEYDNVSLGNIISGESCAYPAESITAETSAHECVITNYPLPVAVNIQKEWVFTNGQSSPDISTHMEIWLYCESEIEIVDCPIYLGPGDPDFPADSPAGDGYNYAAVCIGDVNFYGDGVIYNAVMQTLVVPNFPSTECTVYEYVDDQAIETDNGCGTFDISVGQGRTCTITNTVFYEGIPTLSQYGMAILALLMLGVGFVSFRRFS